MPRLVVLSEGLTGRTHELKGEVTTIGRLEDNSFQVPDPSVSSHHCELTLRGKELQVKDLGSTNGTYVDGAPVRQAALKSGQTVHLGNVQLLYSEQSRSSAPVRIPGGPAVRMVTRDSSRVSCSSCWARRRVFPTCAAWNSSSF